MGYGYHTLAVRVDPRTERVNELTNGNNMLINID